MKKQMRSRYKKEGERLVAVPFLLALCFYGMERYKN